jgi:hypothetical protein
LQESVVSIRGALIRLTDERWSHIQDRHPEMMPFKQEVLETLRNPAFICQGDQGELKAISNPSSTGYVWVVVYRELTVLEGFVITAHMGRAKTLESLKKRPIVWKRPN